MTNAAVSRIVRNEFVPSRTRITLTILERAAKSTKASMEPTTQFGLYAECQ